MLGLGELCSRIRICPFLGGGGANGSTWPFCTAAISCHLCHGTPSTSDMLTSIHSVGSGCLTPLSLCHRGFVYPSLRVHTRLGWSVPSSWLACCVSCPDAPFLTATKHRLGHGGSSITVAEDPASSLVVSRENTSKRGGQPHEASLIRGDSASAASRGRPQGLPGFDSSPRRDDTD